MALSTSLPGTKLRDMAVIYVYRIDRRIIASATVILSRGKTMKEPGLDGRRRDENGRIQQKRGDTLNKNLPQPIHAFSPNAKLGTMS
jgi:hypothetical protein